MVVRDVPAMFHAVPLNSIDVALTIIAFEQHVCLIYTMSYQRLAESGMDDFFTISQGDVKDVAYLQVRKESSTTSILLGCRTDPNEDATHLKQND